MTRSRIETWFAAAMAVITVTTLASACGSDDTSSPAPTTSTTAVATAVDVDVDGRTLHLECAGTGSPTVVLQSGFGNAGDIWSLSETDDPAVAPALATTNRVCTYDRPGSMITTTTRADGRVALADVAAAGRSGSVPMPRDPAAVVRELHDLLETADVPGPYVMVGHSLGGPLDVLYARTYPDEVSALVLIDSPMPAERDLITAEQWALVRNLATDPDLVPGYELEAYDLGVLFDEIEAAPPLADVPVVVVVRGEVRVSDDPIPDDFPIPAAELDDMNEKQRQGQRDFAATVPGAEVIVVPGTTHYVYTQRPDAVVDAIRQAIAAA